MCPKIQYSSEIQGVKSLTFKVHFLLQIHSCLFYLNEIFTEI